MEIDGYAFVKYNNANDYIEKEIKPIVDKFVSNPEGTFSFQFYLYPNNETGLDMDCVLPMVVDYLTNVCEFELGMFPNMPRGYYRYTIPSLTRQPGFIRKRNWCGRMESDYVSNYGYTHYRIIEQPDAPQLCKFAIMLTKKDLKRFNIYHKYAKDFE